MRPTLPGLRTTSHKCAHVAAHPGVEEAIAAGYELGWVNGSEVGILAGRVSHPTAGAMGYYSHPELVTDNAVRSRSSRDDLGFMEQVGVSVWPELRPRRHRPRADRSRVAQSGRAQAAFPNSGPASSPAAWADGRAIVGAPTCGFLAIRHGEGHCENEGEPDAERLGGSRYRESRHAPWPDGLKPC